VFSNAGYVNMEWIFDRNIGKVIGGSLRAGDWACLSIGQAFLAQPETDHCKTANRDSDHSCNRIPGQVGQRHEPKHQARDSKQKTYRKKSGFHNDPFAKIEADISNATDFGCYLRSSGITPGRTSKAANSQPRCNHTEYDALQQTISFHLST
jgi:hypothetical protein